MKEFFKSILDAKDQRSSKRFITLIIALHFILSSFCVLAFTFFLIFYIPKGKIDPLLIETLKDILQKDFFIILSGLGFITADNLFNILLETANAKNQPVPDKPTPDKPKA